MSKQLKFTTRVDRNGTYFRAYLPLVGTFEETIARLLTLSGLTIEQARDNGDHDKVSVEFAGTYKGAVFTLYDYKEDMEVHIGGHGVLDVDNLIPELLLQLQDTTPTPFENQTFYDEEISYGFPESPTTSPRDEEALHAELIALLKDVQPFFTGDIRKRIDDALLRL
jgi:hypothetical protein